MTARTKAVGNEGQMRGSTRGESLINVVNRAKPQVLRGLPKMVGGLAWEFPSFPNADEEPPADRRELPHLLVQERNVLSP